LIDEALPAELNKPAPFSKKSADDSTPTLEDPLVDPSSDDVTDDIHLESPGGAA